MVSCFGMIKDGLDAMDIRGKNASGRPLPGRFREATSNPRGTFDIRL